MFLKKELLQISRRRQRYLRQIRPKRINVFYVNKKDEKSLQDTVIPLVFSTNLLFKVQEILRSENDVSNFTKDAVELQKQIEKVMEEKQLRLCFFALFEAMCNTYKLMYTKEEDGKIKVW